MLELGAPLGCRLGLEPLVGRDRRYDNEHGHRDCEHESHCVNGAFRSHWSLVRRFPLGSSEEKRHQVAPLPRGLHCTIDTRRGSRQNDPDESRSAGLAELFVCTLDVNRRRPVPDDASNQPGDSPSVDGFAHRGNSVWCSHVFVVTAGKSDHVRIRCDVSPPVSPGWEIPLLPKYESPPLSRGFEEAKRR